jgi:glycosyltransferase involved in cell wall biosynthesis
VAFGTYDQRSHPRVAVLIEGLRAHGDEVVEVNEPLKLDTAGRVQMLREPWRLPMLAGKLLRCWFALARRARRLRGPHAPEAVLVGYLGHFDVRLARLLFRRTPIVLDHLVSATGTARDRGLSGASGLKYRLLAAIDNGALRRADLVVVDTTEHLAALPEPARARGVVAPVGATGTWFTHGAARPPVGTAAGSDEALTAVFVGVFTPLHGTATIGAALAELAAADIDITMIGSGQDLAACRAAAAANPRVTWIDWLPAEELPAVVGSRDVSLGIFGTTPKALNVVPNKVYQGAAAGTAVVTSDTPPQRAAMGDAAVYVPPGDVAALVSALRGLAKDRAEARRLGRAAYQVASDRFTPAAVVVPIRDSIARTRP